MVMQEEEVEASVRSFKAEAVTVPKPALISLAKAAEAIVQTITPATAVVNKILEAE
jgi:hypothetical protein